MPDMIPIKRLTRFAILAVFLAGATQAWAEARVQVVADAAIIRISAEVDAKVDREVAWGVLTDYNHWAEFVPDLLVSRVISRPGEPLRLEQRGRIPWLPNFPVVMLVAVEESPPKLVRMQRIAGNVRALQGEWQIQGNAPVRLVYRSVVEPGFPMPPQVSVDIFRHDAKVRLEAMAQEMERRAGAGR